MSNKLDTQPYKGTRDFYPEDMAIQRYMFDTWSKTAELFGYERYDASILEPAELYKSKGAENEELVNEQTYTFTDRGDREVTLRPEMTPTVARMIATKRRELSFPVRWYSIPNLFRYERPQRGRLREHWQLNCDLFGSTNIAADVEIIALAYHTLIAFGATPEMFEIRLNDRGEMQQIYASIGVTDLNTISRITKLNDRFHKISREEYQSLLNEIVSTEIAEKIISLMTTSDNVSNPVMSGLRELGITNVRIDRSLARGFDYYTGTIFEIFDTSPENNRSLIGGGRYDNLTGLFGGEAIPGIGFGMGDVGMRNFLETHYLLDDKIITPKPTLVLIPTDDTYVGKCQQLARYFRDAQIATAVDFGTKKLGKKIGAAGDAKIPYIIVIGADEIQAEQYTLKHLESGEEQIGSIATLVAALGDT